MTAAYDSALAPPHRSPPHDDRSLALLGFGAARADLAAIAALRKALPAWAPADTPGHFLKHADEQTVLAVAAVDRAIAASGSEVADRHNWMIIAAPRFVGRSAGAATLTRFHSGGGPAVSPHTIPQHSLHSISGALSILLQSRLPNYGVGGAAQALAEGLLAALTIPVPAPAGVWLVATAWDPEPQLDAQGRCTNVPTCHALALALRAQSTASARGNLRLLPASLSPAAPHFSPDAVASPSVPELIAALEQSSEHSIGSRFRWHFPWGAALELECGPARDAQPTSSRRAIAA